VKISAARGVLARGLPPVLLLTGQGAELLARETWRRYGMSGLEVPFLTADAARGVVWESNILPRPGARYRDFLIFTDRADASALDILLKVLEEPPATCRFILSGSSRPMPTIESRCRVIMVGLPEAQREQDPPELARVRGRVGSAIKAARSGDPDLLTRAVRGWGPEHTAQLELWATEAASGRWDLFTPEFAPGVLPVRALRVKAVLRGYSRSRTAGVVALERSFAPG
jgi:DNA polymerase III, delta subunit